MESLKNFAKNNMEEKTQGCSKSKTVAKSKGKNIEKRGII